MSSGLQGREALCGREGNVLHLVGVAQDGGRHGAADVDGQARPSALTIDLHEARRRRAEAAHDLSSHPHAIEDRPRIDTIPDRATASPIAMASMVLRMNAPCHALSVIPSAASDLSGSSKGPSLRSG